MVTFSLMNTHLQTKTATYGQSYQHFTIIIYDPRVVIWGVFKSGTTL